MSDPAANPLDNMTLGQLRVMGEEFGIPGLTRLIRRQTASNYSQFVDALYLDMDEIIAIIQENPELRKDDEENRLTIDIVNMLRTMGYQASHDMKIGGHTDISVRGKNNYLWIGEAKIHGAYDELLDGFKQLCTRYSTGDTRQNCGGMIIYIRNIKAAAVVTEWRSRLSEEKLENYTAQECPALADMAFYSSHIHERSGMPFHVRHVGVILRFDPKDGVKAA